MFETELTLYQYTLVTCRRMAADIREDQMRTQPTPDGNPPVWILGHLAVATDYAASILGLGHVCPEHWHKSFGTGSTPLSPGSATPTKSALMQAIEHGHERVVGAIQGVSPERLKQAHGVAIFERTPVRTFGDLLGHLLTTHEALHLGQLSVCRRNLGYSPLM